ncbi:MAG: HDIG domain-containing protein [Candidatus Woesearchaeota archaeon]
MDTLIKALKDLKINGTEEEEREFEDFKKQAIKDAVKEEKEVLSILKELKAHHTSTLKHNMMVARDTEYIARQLGLSDDKAAALKIAALLHDIGKLDIHEAVLDLEGGEESEVWKTRNPEEPVPEGNLLKHITLRDVIEHKAGKSADPEEYRRSFLEWLGRKGLERFLDRPLREYLNHHQHSTRSILERLGIRKEIIDYAAGHHPSYFSSEDMKKLPKECAIIEVADKFNAIIQSEGVRNYFSKKLRTEALDIIAQQMKKEYGGFFKTYEKESLHVLVKRYLPPEVSSEILPKAHRIISHLKEHMTKFRTIDNEEERKQAERIVGLIAVTLALSREFGDVLDNSTARKLEDYEKELKEAISSYS